MVSLRYIPIIIVSLALQCSALFEEPIVEFADSGSSVPITQANVICSKNDETGVHIAASSLATDLEAITGAEREVIHWQDDAGPLSNSTYHETAIIVGSLNSSLIRHLSDEGIIDVSDLEGKWESFVTTVVDQPFPSIEQALVIAGSDKRGAIFGIYTLSEQSGQSPYGSSYSSQTSVRRAC